MPRPIRLYGEDRVIGNDSRVESGRFVAVFDAPLVVDAFSSSVNIGRQAAIDGLTFSFQYPVAGSIELGLCLLSSDSPVGTFVVQSNSFIHGQTIAFDFQYHLGVQSSIRIKCVAKDPAFNPGPIGVSVMGKILE